MEPSQPPIKEVLISILHNAKIKTPFRGSQCGVSRGLKRRFEGLETAY